MSIPSSGTTFSRSDDGGTSFDLVAGINSLSFPEMTKATNDISLLDSTDAYKEFSAGQIDPGELGLVLVLDDTDTEQDNLYADFEGQSLGDYRITFSNGTTFTFKGHCTTWGRTVEKDNDVLLPTGFKLSGRPVWG